MGPEIIFRRSPRILEFPYGRAAVCFCLGYRPLWLKKKAEEILVFEADALHPLPISPIRRVDGGDGRQPGSPGCIVRMFSKCPREVSGT
jgi:hypothetical protein